MTAGPSWSARTMFAGQDQRKERAPQQPSLSHPCIVVLNSMHRINPSVPFQVSNTLRIL